MKYLSCLFLTTFLILTFTFAHPQAVGAKNIDATSEYNITVRINEKGRVWVEHSIHLVNKSKDFFIRDYALVLDHTDLTGLQVEENGKEISFRKEFLDDKVRVLATLRNELVKVGDSTNLKFTYETRQIFYKEGFIWKLFIPAVKTEETLLNAYITVKIPDAFGGTSYGFLKEKSVVGVDGMNEITYRQQEDSEGLLLLLGNKQQFEFSYSFLLHNESGERANYRIVLPPDTNHQRVYYMNAQPLPDQTLISVEENVFAQYQLEADEQKEVTISGFTSFLPVESYHVENIDTEAFLGETAIWDHSSDQIVSLAEELIHPDYSTYDNARLLYDYVIERLEFSTDADTKRISASSIVRSEEPVRCQQYADLFVALSRAGGIPSRVAVGYTTSFEKANTLHYWVEFYDRAEQHWVSADPCFEEIFEFNEFEQIDLNRIVLGYWGSIKSPEILTPFESYQEDHAENLTITTSTHNLLETQQFVYVDSMVLSPNFFKREIPLSLSISNNSQSVFVFDAVNIDGELSSVIYYDDEHFFSNGVFPTQTRIFQPNLGQMKNFDFDPSKNHLLSITGFYGEKTFSQEEVFNLTASLLLLQGGLWVGALFLAVITTSGVTIAWRRIDRQKVLMIAKSKFTKLKEFRLKRRSKEH